MKAWLFLVAVSIPMLGMAARVPDSSIFFPLKVLAIPIAIGVLFSWRDWRQLRKSNSWRFCFGRLFIYLGVLVYGWFGYLALNGIFTVDNPVKYEGLIVEKSSNSTGRSIWRHITLKTSSGEQIRLHISEQNYSRLNIGASYCTTYKRGWLGVTFEWVWDWDSSLECV